MKYTIIKQLLPMFEEKLQKLVKKFNKYGKCSVNVSKPYVCEDKNDSKYMYYVVDVDVDASYKIEGYEFVASCEWLDEIDENLIKKPSDDVFVPAVYKTRRQCDHCKTNRNRKHTVILRKGEEYIQVGTACCRDYLGVDLGNYAAYLSFFDSLEQYIEENTHDTRLRAEKVWELDYALGQAVELTRHGGYISKQVSWDMGCDSTASRLWQLLAKSMKLGTNEPLYPEYPVTSQTEADVEAVKSFYTNIEENDFIGNIKSILKLKYIDGSQVGLVAAAVGTKLRIENKREENEKRIKSEFVGNVGEKVTFKCIPQCIYSTESAYGMYYIYRMMFGSDEIVWRTSKAIDCDEEVEITATIRDHGIYNGVKQTEITRAKVKRC